MIGGIGFPELIILAPFILGAAGYYVLVFLAARAKGRGFLPWALLCTITGPLGLIVLLLLPPGNKGGAPQPAGEPQSE